MAIRWGRVFFVLFMIMLAINIVLHVKDPDILPDMFSALFDNLFVQALLFLGVPFCLLVLLVYTISRMIRWFRKE
jgi:hypothetical protein